MSTLKDNTTTSCDATPNRREAVGLIASSMVVGATVGFTVTMTNGKSEEHPTKRRANALKKSVYVLASDPRAASGQYGILPG